jgi:hypothetical protein
MIRLSDAYRDDLADVMEQTARARETDDADAAARIRNIGQRWAKFRIACYSTSRRSMTFPAD